MEKDSLLFLLSLVCSVSRGTGETLCKFEKMFPHTCATCDKSPDDLHEGAGTPREDTYTQEPRAVSPNNINCFEINGSSPFWILNGSSAFNSDCSRMITCINGEINVLEDEYNCTANAVCEIRNNVRKCYCTDGFILDGEVCSKRNNCLDIFNYGYTANGIYEIWPSNWNDSPFEVYCNMDFDGGWTVIQRRVDGSVDFYRNWTSYKEGFGELDHEFWMGNDKLYYLTNDDIYTLRIDMVDILGIPLFAEYDMFRIKNESDNYRLIGLGTFSGFRDAIALESNEGSQFSTFDKDNDDYPTNCAEEFRGAFWYDRCTFVNLNGDYHAANDSESGVIWAIIFESARFHNIRFSEMKIRPTHG